MYRTILCWSLTLAGLLFTAPSAIAAQADDDYAAAAARYSASQWSEAAEAFGRFLDLHANHERAVVARFYRGESLAQSGKYELAASVHGEFLEQAPQHAFSRVARFRAGECLLLAGKNDQAKVRLEEFRREFPADDLNSFALPYLGEIALAAGRTDEAEACYVQALRDYPDGPLVVESRFGLARCRQVAGQPADAIAFFEQVAANPEQPLADDARLQIGLLQYQSRKFAAAEESLSAFRTTFAKSDLAPQAWYWLGLCQQAAGRPVESAQTLAAAAKRFEDKPEAAALHAAAGDALRRATGAAEADEHYQRIAKEWPQSEWADDALLARAEMALEAGEPERAAAIAAELERRYPASPHAGLAAVIHARGLVAAEKFAEAEQRLLPLLAAHDAVTAAGDGAGATSNTKTYEQAAYLMALAQVGQRKHEAALQSLARLDALPASEDLSESVEEVRCTALLGLGRYTEASDLLQTRLAAQPADARTEAASRVQLAVALARLGKFGEVIAQIDHLPAEATTDADVAGAVLVAAEAAYDANQLRVAARLFTLIAREEVPAEPRSHALSGLAWTQFRLAGKQASAATFERLLRDYPESPLAPEAALVRARSLLDLKQPDAALATYRLVLDKYVDSPHVPEALWGAARLHGRLGQQREAAELLTRLIDEHPKFAQRDAALYELGWTRAELQEPVLSEMAHGKLVAECPDSEFWADAAYTLAELAARRKETDKAIELADQLLAKESAASVRENALYLRGQLAAAQGDWKTVATCMGQHAEQFPKSPVHLSARFWRAEAAFRQNDFAAAEQQLVALDAAIQARQEAWLGIVPLRRAQCLAQQKRWPEALRLAESVAKRYPQFLQLHEADYLIGRALGSLARFEEARTAYERVLSSSAAKNTETAAMAQWMIGESCFHQKRYTAATEAYERCLREHQFPRWQAAALLQAGKCRLLQGDVEAARRDLTRVASEFADQPLAAEAKSRLAALDTNPRAAATVAGRPAQP